MLREAPWPIATEKVPSVASGSTRKPPVWLLKFGVNSMASASSLAYAFHFSQNSTVTVPVDDRFIGI